MTNSLLCGGCERVLSLSDDHHQVGRNGEKTLEACKLPTEKDKVAPTERVCPLIAHLTIGDSAVREEVHRPHSKRQRTTVQKVEMTESHSQPQLLLGR